MISNEKYIFYIKKTSQYNNGKRKENRKIG